VRITEGLTWILVLRYVRQWHNAVAVFLGLSEGSPFGGTPSNEMLRSAVIHHSACQAWRAYNTYCGYRRLVVQDHAEEATMDHQPAHGAGIINKAKLPELVHEMADP
jgi:hypothetical protein